MLDCSHPLEVGFNVDLTFTKQSPSVPVDPMTQKILILDKITCQNSGHSLVTNLFMKIMHYLLLTICWRRSQSHGRLWHPIPISFIVAGTTQKSRHLNHWQSQENDKLFIVFFLKRVQTSIACDNSLGLTSHNRLNYLSRSFFFFFFNQLEKLSRVLS